MKRMTRRSGSWIVMVSLCGLAGSMGTWGCGDDEGGGGAGAASGSGTSSSAAESSSSASASSSAESSSSASSSSTSSASSSSTGQTGYSVTFTVDTTKLADGVNLLAEVLPNESVFMVGSFNEWDPQDVVYAMEPVPGSAGLFAITLTFPLDIGGGNTLSAGDMMEYKFTKTSDDPANGWGNGIKNFFPVDAVHTCPNYPNETVGLFETGNLTLTIPDVDTELQTVVIDAWRNYAESFGYFSCN